MNQFEAQWLVTLIVTFMLITSICFALYCPHGTVLRKHFSLLQGVWGLITERVLFFLGSWGTNRSAGQPNRVNREAVLGQFVCSALWFIPYYIKKDNHSLYLQCFHQRFFPKFFEKSYKFKFLLFTDPLSLIWCKSLRLWFGPLANYFMNVFIGNWIENFRMVQ